MPKVYVAKCGDYEYSKVNAVIIKGIEALGGPDKLLGTGKKVAVKPNLLKMNKPDDCVTTHPCVVQSVLAAVVKNGNEAKIVESSAGAYNKININAIFEATGMTAAVKKAGAKLNDNFEVEQVSLEHGQKVKTLRIIKSILDADSVISVAKLKTHSFMTYTGAVKNLFGVVPGLSKAEYHFRWQNREDFAGMIVDIAEFVKPSLSVIDGVWAMEGEGPSAGDKRKVGVIIMSDCPYSADIVAGYIIGLDWQENPVLKNAVQRNLCREQDIEIIGDTIDDLMINDFVKPRIYAANILEGRVPRVLVKPINKWLTEYPRFSKNKCVACGICEQCCPNDAIIMGESVPELTKDKCINCYCCHELCPKKAVEIKRSWVLKLLIKIFK